MINGRRFTPSSGGKTGVAGRPPTWPFPSRLLDYPVLPPGVKPVRPAPQPTPDLKDLPPALF
jgi:hypothetical protein